MFSYDIPWVETPSQNEKKPPSHSHKPQQQKITRSPRQMLAFRKRRDVRHTITVQGSSKHHGGDITRWRMIPSYPRCLPSGTQAPPSGESSLFQLPPLLPLQKMTDKTLFSALSRWSRLPPANGRGQTSASIYTLKSHKHVLRLTFWFL